MSQLPSTQTEFSQSLDFSGEILTPKFPWGILHSLSIDQVSYELYQDDFRFGRHPDCDVTADKINTDKRVLLRISKQHFKINKVAENMVILEDESINGTWINGNLIGQKNRVVLEDGDVISVGVTKFQIYMFKLLDIPVDDFLPEELKKRFVVTKTLGRGAFGDVKLAFAKKGCVSYAIKKIAKMVTATGTVKTVNEVAILKVLSHPCIVMMKDVMETDQSFFIALEYMEGGTLQERIKSGTKLSEPEVKMIFYQIILAVNYLHENKVIHRDLKPANILLRIKNNETIAKVSDFGLSKLMQSQAKLVTSCGTPFYMAPEIILSHSYQKVYSKKIDIWSCGVILYYMLSRELPFTALDAADRRTLGTAILEGKYQTVSSKWRLISWDAQQLIARMLVTNPDNRITAEEVEEHEWLKDNEMIEKVKLLLG